MTRALQLAGKARGRTLPNPMVGAVLVKNGQIVGQGSHKGPGKPHAEIVAISKAGRKAHGSTLYVNLEPCCHTGRTGPCTDSIIKAGIKRVVYAATDPNPSVNGKGARTLRKAGIEVTNGLLSKEATRFNDVYMGITKIKRPYVTVKLAQSLDGRIATASGDSKWISGKESRKYVHELRAESQAVMVGMGTVRKDNPKLTTRLVKGISPYRIVVANFMELNNKHNLISANDDFKTIIATYEKVLKDLSKSKRRKNITYWALKKSKYGNIDLSDLLLKARAFGIHSILVEGGAELVTSLLKAKLVDKLILITAPTILGSGVNTIGDLGISKVSSGIRFNDYYRFKSGDDEIFVGYPKWDK